MDWLAGTFLLLHIGGAIIGFGATFTFPFIGSMAAGEPMHANFAVRLNRLIATRLVMPLVILQPITGIGLIWTLQINVFAHLWLLLGITFYVIALADTLVNQIPMGRALERATASPPQAPAHGAPVPSGPALDIARITRRIQLGGIAETILLLAIIVLMVLGTNGLLP